MSSMAEAFSGIGVRATTSLALVPARARMPRW